LLSAGHRLPLEFLSRGLGLGLCAEAVGVQLAQVVRGGGEQPFAVASVEAAARHCSDLLAGFDLAEHRFDGLGAELVVGAAAVVAHSSGGARGGGEPGQVAAPGRVADAVGGWVFGQRREQP
jgi:hypothetical protein